MLGAHAVLMVVAIVDLDTTLACLSLGDPRQLHGPHPALSIRSYPAQTLTLHSHTHTCTT